MSLYHQHAHRHSHVYKHLLIAVGLTLSFAAIEGIFGWYANSLALMGDAGHMLADSSSLLLAAFAAWIAGKPPSQIHSYGYGRAEVLAAMVSSITLIIIAISVTYEAIHRLKHVHEVNGQVVVLVASIGVVINVIVAYVMHRSEQTINTRAAFLHVLGDLLGSLAALVSGVVIHYTHWYMIDPILSIFIVGLIALSALHLLKEAMSILMESVPSHIAWSDVKQDIEDMAGIRSVNDLHIWTLSTGQVALSAHLELTHFHDWPDQLLALQTMLADKHQIRHSTLQPESDTTQHNHPHCDPHA